MARLNLLDHGEAAVGRGRTLQRPVAGMGPLPVSQVEPDTEPDTHACVTQAFKPVPGIRKWQTRPR